ncbi:hypothetical protein NEOKW01_0670 [Nematocida sp. AWRm80]|nr:hypothetical protein NEOKW01_0670 [Nematocida sp. AWRm80]
MSQWSRRANGSIPARNLSLPIFFEGISDENREKEIQLALKNSNQFSFSSSRTINLSCLAIKKLPLTEIVKCIKGEYASSVFDAMSYERPSSEQKVILNLEGNLIEDLPVELVLQPSIIGLLLRSNRLQTLPIQIANLTNLTMLTLANNPIEYLPIEVSEMKITNFTISQSSFLSDREIEQRNFQTLFRSKTLNELCINNLDSAIAHSRTTANYTICSVCKHYSNGLQPVFKKQLFNQVLIPFMFSVCSQECKSKVLPDTSQTEYNHIPMAVSDIDDTLSEMPLENTPMELMPEELLSQLSQSLPEDPEERDAFSNFNYQNN